MAQTLQTLSTVSFAVAGVCFAVAAFFWFFFKIPAVFGDLSGRNARKSIAKMRAANERSGVKSYKESKTNVERGKITGTIQGIGGKELADGDPETGLLSENKADGLASEATSILGSETTGLLIDEEATAPLVAPAHRPPARTGGKKINMIEDVVLIHTDETIGC